jgi:hypothetical protein
VFEDRIRRYFYGKAAQALTAQKVDFLTFYSARESAMAEFISHLYN